MIKFGNFIIKDNNSWLSESSSPGPTPPTPVLPAGTVRVRTSDGNAPVKGQYTSYETATLVSGTSDVYDVYKSGTSFYALLHSSTNVTEVIAVNTTGITDMHNMFVNCTALASVALFDTSSVTRMDRMFVGCTSLTTVPLFDTSSVTVINSMFEGCTSLTTVPLLDTSNITNLTGMFNGCTSLTTVPLFDTSSCTDMSYMFQECSSLSAIPLFDTSSATNMNYMFYKCYNVESGALALYQQASTQTHTPSHSRTFRYCGRDTVTGAAELAQIPSDWK